MFTRKLKSVTPTSPTILASVEMERSVDEEPGIVSKDKALVLSVEETHDEVDRNEVARERAKRKRKERNATAREQLQNLDPDERGGAKETIKKSWNARPTNWRVISQHFKESKSATVTIDAFPEIFNDYSVSQKSGYLYRWRKDYENGRSEVKPISRGPSYGADIDERLLTAVKMRYDKGDTVDYTQLRELLVLELTKSDKQNLLFENDGPYIFGNSWAQRFFKRHKLFSKSEGGEVSNIIANKIDEEGEGDEEEVEESTVSGRIFGDQENSNQASRPKNNITVLDTNCNIYDIEQSNDDKNEKKKKKKICKPRPSNWDIIAKYFIQSHSISATIKSFPEVFTNYSISQKSTYLYRWRKDFENGKNSESVKTVKAPIYGNEIDQKLLLSVKMKYENGNIVDCNVLRELLIIELEKNNQLDLLLNNSSRFCFGKSWAQRFFKRHNIQSNSNRNKNVNNVKEKKKIRKNRCINTLYNSYNCNNYSFNANDNDANNYNNKNDSNNYHNIKYSDNNNNITNGKNHNEEMEMYIRSGAAIIEKHRIPLSLILNCTEVSNYFISVKENRHDSTLLEKLNCPKNLIISNDDDTNGTIVNTNKYFLCKKI